MIGGTFAPRRWPGGRAILWELGLIAGAAALIALLPLSRSVPLALLFAGGLLLLRVPWLMLLLSCPPSAVVQPISFPFHPLHQEVA